MEEAEQRCEPSSLSPEPSLLVCLLWPRITEQGGGPWPQGAEQ